MSQTCIRIQLPHRERALHSITHWNSLSGTGIRPHAVSITPKSIFFHSLNVFLWFFWAFRLSFSDTDLFSVYTLHLQRKKLQIKSIFDVDLPYVAAPDPCRCARYRCPVCISICPAWSLQLSISSPSPVRGRAPQSVHRDQFTEWSTCCTCYGL